MLVQSYRNDNTIIRVLSNLRVSSDLSLKQYVRKFINLRVFPYVNSMYGKLVEDFYEKLAPYEKKEILEILKKRMTDIDKIKYDEFKKLKRKEINQEFNIRGVNKKNMFAEISGGHYGEMFLNYIFISLGYEKILSKLYIEWGKLSPTGIDVPYIDLEKRVLLLGESKIYKNIKNAIDNVIKDIINIHDGIKLENEIIEWNSKIGMMPDRVKDYFVNNNIENQCFFEQNFNKILIVGLVIGDNIETKKLKEKIDNISIFLPKEKYEIIILVVPVVSKDEFIQNCIEVIDDMIQEIGDANE